MKFELRARTEPGARFVGMAEEHAETFRLTAADHDINGAFPFEWVDEMKRSGFVAACVPTELGGLGLESVHDLAVGMGRLGRGDGSIAIGITMHFLVTWGTARRLRMGDGAPRPGESLLREIAAGNLVVAVLNSESGSDNRHPFAEATRTDGGYLVNGRKAFGTLSPAAQLVSVRVRLPRQGESYRMASALVRTDAPGVESLHNWDAMGMRASGSHDIVLKDVFVAEGAIGPPTPWGVLGEAGTVGGTISALSLSAVFMGIAEEAHRLTLETIVRRKRQPDGAPLAHWYPVQEKVAEMEVSLAAMRAMLDRSGRIADAYFGDSETGEAAPANGAELLKDAQCTKRFLNRTAVEVVNAAVTISGGAAYMSRNRLSQLYRDVRAGPFMSPFNEFEAAEYIGRVALGLPGEAPISANG
jgi:alkylation response protein AidB-like acyl-CoA dehydrogenase